MIDINSKTGSNVDGVELLKQRLLRVFSMPIGVRRKRRLYGVDLIKIQNSHKEVAANLIVSELRDIENGLDDYTFHDVVIDGSAVIIDCSYKGKRINDLQFKLSGDVEQN